MEDRTRGGRGVPKSLHVSPLLKGFKTGVISQFPSYFVTKIGYLLFIFLNVPLIILHEKRVKESVTQFAYERGNN